MKRFNSFIVVALLASLSTLGGLVGCGDQSSTKPADQNTSTGAVAQPEVKAQPQVERAKIGDPAKPLAISAWLKGASNESPIDVTDKKNVYVVEFWATWCGPCKVSIPHLSELQKKYKDQGVVIVGISDEELSTVKPFVEEQGEKMDYVVAVDKENATGLNYMEAFGKNSIPCAFVINKEGQIAWVGHPMKIDQPLEEILAGKYDLSLFTKVGEYAQMVADDDPKAKEKGQALLKEVGTRADLLEEMLESAYEGNDYDFVYQILDQLATVSEEDAKRAKGIRSQIMANQAVEEYMEASTSEDPQVKDAAETKLVEFLKGNADAMTMVAEQIAGEGESPLLEKLLTQLSAVDEKSAKVAAQIRKTVLAQSVMVKYLSVAQGDNAAEREAVEKELFEALKGGESSFLAQAAYSIVMNLKEKATATLPLQLLDEADKTQVEKPVIPNDFFRAVVYIKTGDAQKGKEFAEKALAGIEDEQMKEQMSSYIQSLQEEPAEKK